MGRRKPLTEAQLEAKRKRDRERVARIRASQTPEERADARRGYDETYRDTHRWERAEYDREYQRRQREGKHSNGRW